MNIYFRELKANKKAVIIWSICMILFVVMGMQKYNAMIGPTGNGSEMLKMLDSMPKILQTMWGLSVLDITKPIGYFGILFFYLALMAAIHAGMLGANIVSKEERDKTIEFLMVKPVSRNKIITSKMLASLTNIVIVNLSIFIPVIIILKNLSNDSIAREMALCMTGMFFIQFLFMAIGISIAGVNKNPKKTNMITMSILMFSFFLSIIIDMSESFKFLSFLTPFKYFDAKDLLVNGSFNMWYVLLTVIIIIGVLALSYKKYTKRDLYL